MAEKELYLKMRKNGLKSVQKASAEGRFPYLRSLERVLPEYDKLPKMPLGSVEVPLDMIAGTLTAGRENAFSWDFYPILGERSEFAAKWMNLYTSQQEVGIREPAVIFEYMNRYYVQEGNKRVSVLKASEGDSIPANVTRIMPRRDDSEESRIYYEYVDFYAVTRILEITFSKEGAYEKLAAAFGQNLKEEWPESVVEELTYAYRTFQKIYDKKGGKKLNLTAGDAFLRYVLVYGRESFDEDAETAISGKIKALWFEYLADEEDAVLITDPGQRQKNLMDVLTNFVRPVYTKEQPLRVAFLYQKNPQTSSWVYGHELGRNELLGRYDGIVDAIYFENCDSEAAIDEAFSSAAVKGVEVVFTTSPMMMQSSVRAAIKFPYMKIFNCSVNLSSSAVRTYYSRMYEARFLMGALAASISDDHRLGYVADYPIYGTMAGINAFALGASLVDPQAKVYLYWSGKKGEDWEKLAEEDGVRLISGPTLIRPDHANRKYGLFSVDGPGMITNIAAPMWNWGRFYGFILDSILDGTYEERDDVGDDKGINYWYGLSAQVVDLFFSNELSYQSRNLMSFLKKGIVEGSLDPFGLELRTKDGVIHREGDAPLTARQIITMDYLLDNVVGSIPGVEELEESVVATLSVSGVNIKGSSAEE